MNVEKLCLYAESQNIDIDEFPMKKAASLSAEIAEKHYSVAIDPSKIETQCDLLVVIGHEIGHCKTKSFYSPCSKPYEVKRAENRADKWAIKKLIPKDEFQEAIQRGYQEPWEIAEYFNVTEDFAYKAMWYYRYGNLAVEKRSFE